MKKTITLSISLIASMLSGCLFQSPSGEDKAEVGFEVRAQAEASPLAKAADALMPLVMQDASGLIFKIEEARINVKKFKLETKDDTCDSADSADPKCIEKDKLSLQGTFVVDLLTGASNPPQGTVFMPAGVYTKIKIKLEEAKKDDGILPANDELIGHTILVKGKFGMAGSPEQPFVLALKMNEDLYIKSSGLTLDAGALNRILISLNTKIWLEGMNVTDCIGKVKITTGPKGELIITEDSDLGKCLDLENTLKVKIKFSFKAEKKV